MGRPRSFDEDEAVEQAMRLFWRRGFEGTSIRDLGEELGLRPGSLYAAFGDKHALFLRALDRYRQGQGEGLLAAVREAGPLLPRLEALLLGVAEANRAGTEPPGCFVVNTACEVSPGDLEVTARLRASLDLVDEALEAALVQASRTGEVAPGLDARATARFLTTLLQGLQVVSKTDPEHGRAAAAVQVAMSVLRPAPAAVPVPGPAA